MKRKLNDQGEPEVVQSVQRTVTSFSEFNLDPRILQAVAKENHLAPTPIQSKAIPLALEGKDVLARSRTGSGKTLAYVLPIVQSILQRASDTNSSRSISALILVPTRELANQVTKVITQFTAFCAKNIHVVNLTPQIHDQAQRALLASSPDIVVSTPARASTHLNSSTLVADKLLHLVVDEADLVLSYGYETDFQNIVELIPKGIQTFLASATLTTEVDTLKSLFCRDPVVLDLQDEEKDSKNLSQYVIKCGEDEKFVLLFALFKLQLIKGKCICFVGDVDRCYRVKLFLEQFGIKSCVLNSELPVNCRIHVVEEFNKNIYDIIIATDENEIAGEVEHGGSRKEKEVDIDSIEATPEQSTDLTEIKKGSNGIHTSKKKPRPHKKDKEYGISRGIDFHAVSCVLNFDLPTSAKSYTHRIGRTARANRTGIALSFVIPVELYRKDKHTSFAGTDKDEVILTSIIASQAKKGQEMQPYNFDMKKLEGFRYRVSSALKAVTPGAIREARIRELRQEMLKSERLKRHLEENPDDEKFLRHDGELRPAKVKPHMKHIPDYLLPNGGTVKDVGFVGLERDQKNRIRKARARNKLSWKSRKPLTKNDPLKTFNAKGKGK